MIKLDNTRRETELLDSFRRLCEKGSRREWEYQTVRGLVLYKVVLKYEDAAGATAPSTAYIIIDEGVSPASHIIEQFSFTNTEVEIISIERLASTAPQGQDCQLQLPDRLVVFEFLYPHKAYHLLP